MLKPPREQLEKGVLARAQQQELIHFVDYSPFGWTVVEIYLQDYIAVDEKRSRSLQHRSPSAKDAS